MRCQQHVITLTTNYLGGKMYRGERQRLRIQQIYTSMWSTAGKRHPLQIQKRPSNRGSDSLSGILYGAAPVANGTEM